jgi:hypothetical protein
MQWQPTHQAQTRPPEAVPFMHQLACNGFGEAEPVFLSEFLHAADRLPARRLGRNPKSFQAAAQRLQPYVHNFPSVLD